MFLQTLSSLTVDAPKECVNKKKTHSHKRATAGKNRNVTIIPAPQDEPIKYALHFFFLRFIIIA